MSIENDVPVFTRPAVRGPCFRSPFAWLSRCYERHLQRASLAELDDRMLCDIGRSRAEARRESTRPFWR